MRLWTLLLGGLWLLSACSAPQVPVRAVPLPAAAESTAAPAAAVAPAAAAAPAVPAGDLKVAPVLNVRTEKAARVYTGRGSWYLLVAELPAGTEVRFLESREGWFKVGLASGETAWLSAADAAVTDGRGGQASYRIQPGRWEMSLGGLTVAVRRAATGVIQVSVSGLPAEALPEPAEAAEGDISLRLSIPGLPGSAELPVGDSGLAGVSVSERGLLVELEDRMIYRVTDSGGGRFGLELRPGLERVERTPGGWSLVWRGALMPVLRQEPGTVVIDLPGALKAGGLPALPEGAVLEEVGPEAGRSDPGQGPGQGSGAESGPGARSWPGPADLASQAAQPGATVPSRMPAGGLRLRLPEQGRIYALYRTGPDRAELRFLPAGLAGRLIALDPGHGGEETGAEGAAGTVEKAVNLQVCLRLKALLEAAGARVVMTRTDDARVLSAAEAGRYASVSERTQADLAARSALVNREGADLLISVHSNGGPEGDGGTETYWAVNNLNAALSQRLAGLAQAEVAGALGLSDRGAKQRPFNVIRMSDAPAVLVEMGFLTNPAEEQLLTSAAGQEKAAAALLKAVQRYFGEL